MAVEVANSSDIYLTFKTPNSFYYGLDGRIGESNSTATSPVLPYATGNPIERHLASFLAEALSV